MHFNKGSFPQKANDSSKWSRVYNSKRKLNIKSENYTNIMPSVNIMDEENGLVLYCSEKDYRGVVLDGEKIISVSLPHAKEIVCTSSETIPESLLSDKIKFMPSYEGTLIKIFFHTGKWYFSSNKRINAKKSRWADNKTFFDQFNEYLSAVYSTPLENSFDVFCSTLNPTTTYLFLIRSTGDNKIISQEPQLKDSVFYIGLINTGGENSKISFLHPEINIDDDIGFAKATLMDPFNTQEELFNKVDRMDYSLYQGVIAFDTTTNTQIKLLNQTYHNLSLVRNNEPSIKYRYLQVRNDHEMVRKLTMMYPKYIEFFAEYERILNDIVFEIYNFYMQKFVRREYINTPVEYNKTLYFLHNNYKKDKISNKVTPLSTRRVVDSLPVNVLNSLIKIYVNKKRNEN